MHVIGGYGEGRVDRGYHHVYEPRTDTWFTAAALPRGANHVAVVADQGRIYAFGGFIEQNRNPDNHAYVYGVAQDRRTSVAPLPVASSGHGLVIYRDRLFAMGGEGGIINRVGQQTVFGQMESYDWRSDSS